VLGKRDGGRTEAPVRVYRAWLWRLGPHVGDDRSVLDRAAPQECMCRSVAIPARVTGRHSGHETSVQH
jgi:hypothetical protein